jgi:hypothetical protein
MTRRAKPARPYDKKIDGALDLANPDLFLFGGDQHTHTRSPPCHPFATLLTTAVEILFYHSTNLS